MQNWKPAPPVVYKKPQQTASAMSVNVANPISLQRKDPDASPILRISVWKSIMRADLLLGASLIFAVGIGETGVFGVAPIPLSTAVRFAVVSFAFINAVMIPLGFLMNRHFRKLDGEINPKDIPSPQK